VNLLKKLKDLITKQSLNSLEEMEEFLLLNNFGVEFTDKFIKEVKSGRVNQENLKDVFLNKVREVFGPIESKMHFSEIPPSVFVFMGSNGAGKTTTVAKFAHMQKLEGKSVLIVAGDTFRVQASEQLEEWAKRLNIPIVKSFHGSDPASVVYDGIESAMKKSYDVVLVDTSGRVETKKNLLNEISKIEHVIEKAIRRKPDEMLLVLDAYAGLNAFSQIEIFKEAVEVTGIVLSKFDGSAPAGVVVPIVEKFGIPVKLLGIGEGVKDLQYFSLDAYINKLQ